MIFGTLEPLLNLHRVLVCAGAGGVGKTTVAAALSLAAASRGQRVLCLTIDPAKRLADSLGIGMMISEEQEISAERFARAGIQIPGRLTVLMLDPKRTFDEIIAGHASSPAVRDRILGNRIYQYVSTSLSGTQSYMAMEKVLAVKQKSEYDLIVLDTPPTSHALDFLDAPSRLIDAIDSPAMRWLVDAFERSSRLSLSLLARSVAIVLRAIGKLTGAGFLRDMAEFVTEFNELFGGFRERAAQVAAAFRGPEFAYVLVSTPVAAALDEALFFAERLRDQGMRSDALVINRLQLAEPVAPSSAEVRAALEARNLDFLRGRVEELGRALTDEQQQATLDARALADFEQRLSSITGHNQSGGPYRVRVPVLNSDVHDLGELYQIGQALCGK